MISSLGEKESGVLNVLKSQEGDTSPVYQIPIKKGFSGIEQPTELSPIEIPVRVEEDVSARVETSKTSERFEVPRELLKYLDSLIVQRRLPLKTLKFDIEFAKSIDEIAKYLENYVDKSKIIPAKDLDQLFSLIGYGRNDVSTQESEVEEVSEPVVHNFVQDFFNNKEFSTSTPEPETVIEEPKPENKPENKIEIKTDIKTEAKFESNIGLLEARVGYVELLVPYLEKIKKDRALYSKIMAELGGNADMPFKDEPKELTLAREDYKKAKKESGITGLIDELEEVEVLRREVLKTLDVKMQMRLEKANLSWDRYPNSVLVAEALATEVEGIEKIVDPAPFDGLRASPEDILPPEVVVPTAPIAPAEPAPQEIKQDVKVEPEVVIPAELPTEEVKPEVLVEEKVEEPAPVEALKDEIKFEIVGEGQKIEDEAKKIAENGGTAPVDISVAEKGPTAQNVFPSEFEGKKMEIMVGSPEVSPQIRIIWDGKEIAQGSIVKGKPIVKINDKFKSGFLLADTPEEKALKHAMPIVNTLRSQ